MLKILCICWHPENKNIQYGITLYTAIWSLTTPPPLIPLTDQLIIMNTT